MIFTPDMVAPLREKLKMSREEFGAEVGTGSRSVYNWERGHTAKIPRAVRQNLIVLYKEHMEEK